MCDCPQAPEDKIDLETVVIFSKCPTLFRPEEGDSLEQRTVSTDTNLIPVDFVKLDSSDTCAGSRTSTESSSESSRLYKFIYPRGCECYGEIEKEEDVKPPPVPFEAEEVEEITEEELDIECTLAIIKPEAMIYRKEIERQIYAEGFETCQTRWLQLTPEQASEFYSNRYGDLSFPHLVAYMSSKPILVFVLTKQNAVEEWKRVIGPSTVSEARLYFPDSIRAKYGREGESFKNAVHGSSSRKQAEKEIHFFFPDFIIEPLLRNEMAEDYLWETINPVLVEGLTLCCKTKPDDPVSWLAQWLLMNNPNKPKLPKDLALIPT